MLYSTLNKILISCLLLVLLVSTSVTHAATLNVPSEYPTIQSAIDAAINNEDTVLVAPGTYSEAINFGGKLIVVISSDGPGATTITSNPSTNLVTFNNLETSDAVLEGFRLQGGWIGILCENSSPTIRGNILAGQNVTNWGAISLGGDGYASFGPSPAVIVNNTIVGCANGGISTFSTLAPTIKNNIIAFNGHYGVHRWGTIAHPLFSYNNVYGNLVSYQEMVDSGVGTISANPVFGVDYTLQSGSPCIDAGDPDPAYNDPDDSRNDIGAMPFDETVVPHEPMTLRVPSEYSSIQSAINAAYNGDTILVAPGTYEEHLDFGGKNLKLLSELGPELTLLRSTVGCTVRALPAEFDTLSTEKSGLEQSAEAQRYSSPAVISMIGGSDETTEISGFTIDGRDAVRGIYGIGVDPLVNNCIIEHCLGSYDAGGMFFEHGAPTITNNIVRYNTTPISGGGIFVRLGVGHGTVRIIGNTIYGNISGNGPAISLIEGDGALVERNIAYYNVATPGSSRRGAIYFRGEDVHVVNNTSDNNTVGITALSSTDCDVRNNIITNSVSDGLEFLSDVGPNDNITNDYNDVWNNGGSDYIAVLPGTHDISENPAFGSNYYLLPGSPCINTGDPDPVYNDPDDSRNDMGAVPFDESVEPNEPMTLHVPSDYSTIQLAIDAALNDDTVLVAPGTYEESINFDGKLIVVRSADGPGVTTITSSPSTNLVTFNSLETSDAVLEGFRLQGGWIAILCENSSPTIRGNILAGQNVTNWGAISLGGDGYASFGPSPAVIVNNTIVGCANGGISTYSTLAPTIKNNIIAFNGHYGVHRWGTMAHPLFSYNNVYGNLVSYQEMVDSGVGTISADPVFGVDYTLQPGSPCIDAGDPDPAYNDPDDSRNDIGAMPFGETGVPHEAITLHVPSEYPTIQSAIDAAHNEDTVLVAPGTYSEAINFGGKLIVVISSDGPGATTITSSPSTDLVLFTNFESSAAVLEGFRLQGGWIGILCENSSPTIRGNILAGQNVTNWGAISLGGDGYATVGTSPAVVVNNTIIGCANGGISTFSSIEPIIKNNIIAFNGHYGIHREGRGSVAQPILSYNDIFGNSIPYQEISNPGIGTISADPVFGADYTLQPSSPCINAGDPDPAYNDPDDSRNDMGAMPFDGIAVPHEPMTLRVPYEYPSIQSAINAAYNGDTVLVGAGTYEEHLDFGGKSLKLLSEFGPELTLLRSTVGVAGRALPVEFDTLSTEKSGLEQSAEAQRYSSPAVISMIGGSDETTEISGFTIDGRDAVRGIYGIGVDPLVNNCIVEHCLGSYDAGGMFFEHGAPTITNNIVRYNTTPISGGGIFVRLGVGHGTVRIIGNTIYGNISGNGPAISLIEGDGALVERNIAYSNVATPGSSRRGAIYFRGEDVHVVNNTSDKNTVGITALSSTDCDVRNNIITNSTSDGLEFLSDVGPNDNITSDYNDVWNNGGSDYIAVLPGTNDISENPAFGSNYFLLPGSPCINTGDPDPAYNDPDGSRNDMGAVPFDETIIPHEPITLHVPSEYSTIQLAINAALTDDTVLVAPGTYPESINFYGKQIIVISSDGPLQTTITGPNDANLVTFSGGENSLTVLEGFRLDGGRIGVLCENAGPTIRRNILTDQKISNWGAISLGGDGYATVGSSPAVIINNTIVGCANGGISTFSSVAPVIKNNIIAFNGHYGIHREGLAEGVAQPELSYNDFYGNPVVFQEIADPGIGTIYDDPLLEANYTLQSGSPCFNAGDPDPAYNDQDGSRSDMGAIPYGVLTTTSVSPGSLIPSSFALSQNFPNPFNPATTIEYELATRSQVNLVVYDVLGRRVKTLVSESKSAGMHNVIWSGTDDEGNPVGSGVYFYRLQAGTFVQSMKMLLLK